MNSARSRLFDALVLVLAVALLAACSFIAARWVHEKGYTLYYGDAEAHLNIARRVLDSRTPGPEHLGTVWLPLPHLLMIPFVQRDDLWRNGLAGAIPSSICFVIAGTFLFAAARRAYSSTLSAFEVILIFALNPNLLYLQSTPMTEALFMASLAAIVWAMLWFRDSQSVWAILAAAAAAIAGSLTRYEGWFLIPFVALYFLFVAKRKWHAILFGALAALGPLSWLAHNQYYYSNALEFYNGPWSAAAIYARQLAHGMQPYPGDHDWRAALKYYFTAAKLVVGVPAMIIGVIGLIAMLAKPFLVKANLVKQSARPAFAALLVLALPPAFYIWSMHSSGTPIFVPTLWPFSFYNTRYAIAMLPLVAFASGALVSILPGPARMMAAFILVAIPLSFWFVNGDNSSICWKESQVNSSVRRAWTAEAAAFLAANYRPGSGIIYGFGDLTGVLREAGIPLRESIHEGNVAEWMLSTSRPFVALRTEWALAYSADDVATAVQRAGRFGKNYELRKQIIVKGAPVVEIYQLR
jgi:hypothetical protein